MAFRVVLLVKVVVVIVGRLTLESHVDALLQVRDLECLYSNVFGKYLDIYPTGNGEEHIMLFVEVTDISTGIETLIMTGNVSGHSEAARQNSQWLDELINKTSNMDGNDFKTNAKLRQNPGHMERCVDRVIQYPECEFSPLRRVCQKATIDIDYSLTFYSEFYASNNVSIVKLVECQISCSQIPIATDYYHRRRLLYIAGHPWMIINLYLPNLPFSGHRRIQNSPVIQYTDRTHTLSELDLFGLTHLRDILLKEYQIYKDNVTTYIEIGFVSSSAWDSKPTSILPHIRFQAEFMNWSIITNTQRELSKYDLIFTSLNWARNIQYKDEHINYTSFLTEVSPLWDFVFDSEHDCTPILNYIWGFDATDLVNTTMDLCGYIDPYLQLRSSVPFDHCVNLLNIKQTVSLATNNDLFPFSHQLSTCNAQSKLDDITSPCNEHVRNGTSTSEINFVLLFELIINMYKSLRCFTFNEAVESCALIIRYGRGVLQYALRASFFSTSLLLFKIFGTNWQKSFNKTNIKRTNVNNDGERIYELHFLNHYQDKSQNYQEYKWCKMAASITVIAILVFTTNIEHESDLVKDYELGHEKSFLPNDLLRFGDIKQNLLVFPSSLNRLLSESLDKRSSDKRLMKYEWARLKSFENFPSSESVSAIRLSQNGFYYTGKGTTAVCFSCGATNEVWPKDKAVSDIHKAIAPHCKVVNAADETNEPINASSLHVQPTQNTENKGEGYACGGPSETQTGSIRPLVNADNKQSKIKYGNNESYSDKLSIQVTDNLESEHRHSPQARKDISSPSRQRLTEPSINQTHHVENVHIRIAVAKHPDYCRKEIRLSSFGHWPNSHIVLPEALAEAGLFYTGLTDCVKCFHCDGGMRNWKQGDNPWIEHARWFPHCGFVLQVKGEEFVNTCVAAHQFQDAILGGGLDQTATGISHAADDVVSPFQINAEAHTELKREGLVQTSNCSEAKPILEMGYSSIDVDNAIAGLVIERGSNAFSAEIILNYMIDNGVGLGVYSSDEANNGMHTKFQKETTVNASPTPNSDATLSSTYTERNDLERNSGSDKRDLQSENDELRQRLVCKICMDNEANIIFLPCGHMVSCRTCAGALRKCAICRKRITGSIRAFPL